MLIIFIASFFIPPGLLISSLSAVAVHELGHAAAIHALGGGIAKIVFSPFGLTIHPKMPVVSYSSDAAVALAGIAANAVCASVSFALCGMNSFAAACTVYGLFNLLPVSTLDGGAALFAAVSYFAENEETAGRVLKITSGVTVVILWVFGIFLILRPECGASLFFMTLYLFSSLYLKPHSR